MEKPTKALIEQWLDEANEELALYKENNALFRKENEALQAENARLLEFAQIMHELDYTENASKYLFYNLENVIDDSEAKYAKVNLMVDHLNKLNEDENND